MAKKSWRLHDFVFEVDPKSRDSRDAIHVETCDIDGVGYEVVIRPATTRVKLAKGQTVSFAPLSRCEYCGR